MNSFLRNLESVGMQLLLPKRMNSTGSQTTKCSYTIFEIKVVSDVAQWLKKVIVETN